MTLRRTFELPQEKVYKKGQGYLKLFSLSVTLDMALSVIILFYVFWLYSDNVALIPAPGPVSLKNEEMSTLSVFVLNHFNSLQLGFKI